MNTAHCQGFQPKLPSLAEVAAIRNRFKSIVRGWRTQKLKVVFAYLNALAYRACRVANVLKRQRRAIGERKGFHRFVGDIQAIVLKGISGFNIAIEGVVDQVRNFWDIKISEVSLRKYRYELRDTFDLFEFESQPAPNGDVGNKNARRPPELKDFDLPLSCILLEAIEDVLIRDRGCELTDFPGSGAMSRLIYNRVFAGICSYRRVKIVDDVVVMSQGNHVITASEMDWTEADWSDNEAARASWFGYVHLIPDSRGIVPERVS